MTTASAHILNEALVKPAPWGPTVAAAGERTARAMEVIEDLGLRSCIDTKIGG